MVGTRSKKKGKALTYSEADSGSKLGDEDSELDECLLGFLAAFLQISFDAWKIFS